MASNRLSATQFRALGLLPLSFFIAQGFHYWRIDELGHMLWMCNIGNLILAVGLFLNHAILIRVAVIWTVPGLLVWFVYVVLPWGVFLSSTLAHLGGLAVGIVAIRRVRMDRASWAYALLWYLGIQLVSRLVTAPELNVNLAHAVEPGWRQAFDAYWKFWLVLTVVGAMILWAIGRGLLKLFPASVRTPRQS